MLSLNLQQGSYETVSTVSISEITRRHLIRLKDSMSDLFWGGVTGVVITLSPNLLDTQEGALVLAAAV